MKQDLTIGEQTELLKHSATIHIINSLSMLERKIYNVMLKNAFPSLQKKNVYKVNLNYVKSMIGREGNNYDDIKEAIQTLVKTTVQWNIFNKDNKNEWGITTFLAAASIKNGICTYEYSTKLREFLAAPNIYAKLNLLVQRKFSTKYALILWEYFIDKLSVQNKSSIQTEYIQLDQLRLLLGVENEYLDFKIFNRDILKKSLSEINKVSDIEVEVTYQRQLRKIVALSFKVSRQKNFQYPLINMQNSNSFGETAMSIDSDNKISDRFDISEHLLNILIKEFYVAQKVAQRIVNTYNIEDINQSLDVVRNQIEAGKDIKDIAAYTVKAIDEGWLLSKSSKSHVSEVDQINFAFIENTLFNQEWKTVWYSLKDKIDEATFKSWIAKLVFSEVSKNNVNYLVRDNNKFVKDYIETHFHKILLEEWQKINPKIKNINISLHEHEEA